MTVLFLNSCQNEISEIRAITDVNLKPVQTSYKAEYVFTERGKITNKLIAAQIDQYDGETDFIEATGGFTMIFFDSLEQEEARLSANTGRYTESEKKLVARDQVLLTNAKGEKLETSELTFLQDSARIFTDKSVVITLSNGSMIRGKGLESNDAFTKYRIIQPTGDLYFDEKTDSSHVQSKPIR
ncbi:MAG: LPS export ABC transporter periplasmic protein LptC [Flavobacteriales bacterium]|nr:LPS export ABC transporter periplasmic protein LptC [Flavobacteriales bacterium]